MEEDLPTPTFKMHNVLIVEIRILISKEKENEKEKVYTKEKVEEYLVIK